METNQMNLHQKILKIADAAGVLQKNKEGFGYRYVPEEDIQAKVTAGMQKYGVALYPEIVPGTLTVQPFTYQKYDKNLKREVPVNEFIVKADTIYTWVNVDNPSEVLRLPWAIVGQMADAAQAFGAGETYCNRYFLMKSLQLATSEDDPDSYRSKQKEAENFEEEKIRLEVAAALAAKIQEVVAAGSKMIAAGAQKETVRKIVEKLNGGDGNPSTITDIDVGNKILDAFQSELKKLEEAKK